MKKLIIGLLAIAAAVFIGAPYVTGVIAQNKTQELVDHMNATSSHLGTIEMTDYQRSFMSSSSAYKYIFSKPYQELTKFENIEYSCDLDHGITGVDYSCLLENKGEYKAFLDKHLAGKDPFSMTGHVSAFGKIDQTLSVEPITVESAEETKFNVVEKIHFTTIYDQKSSTYDFDGAIPKLAIENNKASSQGSFDVDAVVLNGKVKEAKEGLYVGEVNISGKQLKALDPNGELTMNDFSINTSTLESGSTVGSSVNLKAETISFPNQSGGIDSFSDVALDVGLYGMDTEALIEYIKANEEMQKKILASAENGQDANQAGLSSMAELVPALEKMLKNGLGLNLKSSLMVDDQKSDIALDLKLVNDMSFTQAMGFLFSPDETLKNFKGSLNVDIKKELLEKYPPLAFTINSVPFFVQSADGVTLDVSIDSGMKINGETTTVAELQSLFR